MNTQKLIRTLKYNFRSLFMECPDSNEELFRSLKHCISLFDPEWVQQLKPSSAESIQGLEQMVEQEFGKALPPSYKLYLQEMGASDGELLLKYMVNLNYYSKIDCFHTLKDRELLHFEIGDMAENPKKCMEQIRQRRYATELTSSFLWYLFPCELFVYDGFAFTLNEQTPDEIVMSHPSAPICYDTFPKQLAYCEYLKAIHWLEDHSEPMKYKKWRSFSSLNSDNIFSARFRAYCPVEWMEEEQETRFPLFAAFLEKIEARFFLEEGWFSSGKLFPQCDLTWDDDYHTFFSRYIAFSPISDLTLLIELHPKYYDYYNPFAFKPFIQVHLLGKDMGELNEIIDAILQETSMVEINDDRSRLFGKMDLE